MNNRETKHYTLFAVLYAAIFLIYTIIVMFAFGEKNDVFWLSYSFMCISFVANMAIAVYSFKAKDVEAAFMGIPLFSFSIFYFFAELFASLVFMIFRFEFERLTTPTIVQLLILLVFVVFAAIAMISRNAVEGVSEDIRMKSQAVKSLGVDVKILEDQCMDPELKRELHKIAETIRFSDPMTNDTIADLDKMIEGKVSELKYHCNNNDKNSAMQACYQLSAFLSERNQKLILSK